MNAPAGWRVLDERPLLTRPPFATVVEQTIALPNGRRVDDYLRIDMRDFVVVVPQLRDGRIAMLHQYKHGVGDACYCFPGGMVEADEDPFDTALRELREETGLAPIAMTALGDFVVNGNNGCGRAYLFQAQDCSFVGREPHDDLEDIDVTLFDVDELRLVVMARGLASLPHAAAYGLAAL